VTVCLNSIETDDGTGMLFSAEAALGIVKEGEFAIFKNKSTSLWNLVLNSLNIADISLEARHVDRP